MPGFPLLYVHHQPHLGVDVAADLEGSRRGKDFGNILARVPFVTVETEAGPLRIDLVDEVVFIGEGQAFAAVDGDLARMKGAALLDDGVGLVSGKGGPKGREGRKHNKKQEFSRRLDLVIHGRMIQLLGRACRLGTEARAAPPRVMIFPAQKQILN